MFRVRWALMGAAWGVFVVGLFLPVTREVQGISGPLRGWEALSFSPAMLFPLVLMLEPRALIFAAVIPATLALMYWPWIEWHTQGWTRYLEILFLIPAAGIWVLPLR